MYAASKDGQITHKYRWSVVWRKMDICYVLVRKFGQKGQKSYQVHRLGNVTTDLSQTAKWLIISMKSEMIIFCIISNWWLSNKIARKQTKNVIILLSNSVTRTRSAWKLWNCDAKEVMYYNSNVISFSIAAGVAKNVSEKCMDTKQVNQKVR